MIESKENKDYTIFDKVRGLEYITFYFLENPN